MKIYLITDENDANRIRQLIKFNSECVKLRWSRTITDLPTEIHGAIETLESFVEGRIYEMCNEKTLVGPLSEDEESALVELLSKIPQLRATLGTGVVMAGEEANKVLGLVRNENISKILVDALASGKNVAVF